MCLVEDSPGKTNCVSVYLALGLGLDVNRIPTVSKFACKYCVVEGRVFLCDNSGNGEKLSAHIMLMILSFDERFRIDEHDRFLICSRNAFQ